MAEEWLDSAPAKLADRIWPEMNSGCWLWSGATDAKGYGRVSRKTYGNSLAHRAVYGAVCGEIPNGSHLCHRCDNPSCVNPDHLFVGDNDANVADMMKKGRQQRLKGEDKWQAKLCARDVAVARRLRAHAHVTVKDLSDAFGVSAATMSHAVTGRTWSHVGGGDSCLD